jgi:hypothetical protein
MSSNDSEQNGVSRRSVMKTAAGLAAGTALAGCSGGGDGDDGDDGGSGGGAESISHLGHITYTWPEQVEKFESISDFEVERTIVSYASIQQRLFSGGNETFDGAGFEGIIGRPALVFNDFSVGVSPDDLDTYTEWSDENISDVFTNPTERLDYLGAQAELLEEMVWSDPDAKETLNMIPTNYNFDSVGYNPKFVEPDSVSTWSPMFDEQYQGQVTLGTVPVISVAEAILHMMDKGMMDESIDAVNNPSQEQIDAAVDFLIGQKDAGQFRALWGTTGQSAELMASEEAVIGNIWQPAVFSVRESGTPCRYATLDSDGIQGFALTTGGFIPTKPGAENNGTVEQIKTWSEFHHGAWYADFVQKRTGYSVPHYPNTSLVRDGEDETGAGMGPEFYDWAYEGKATYDAVDEPALFQPSKYEWSMEEGSPSSDGHTRDGGSIDTRTDNVGTWYTWPDEGSYLSEQWTNFTGA